MHVFVLSPHNGLYGGADLKFRHVAPKVLKGNLGSVWGGTSLVLVGTMLPTRKSEAENWFWGHRSHFTSYCYNQVAFC
jgi:hypothetical protein